MNNRENHPVHADMESAPAVATQIAHPKHVIAPTMIAVNPTPRQSLSSGSDSYKVLCVGDRDQKIAYINALRGDENRHDIFMPTIGVDFATVRGECGKYVVYDVAVQMSFVTLDIKQFDSADVVLLFGADNIQATIARIPESVRGKMTFYTKQDNVFVQEDMQLMTDQDIQLTEISVNSTVDFMDSVIQNAMSGHLATAVAEVHAPDTDEPTVFQRLSSLIF